MKILRVIKNLGLYPIYAFGAIFCVGLLVTGALAIDKKDSVKQYLNSLANTANSISTTLSDADNSFTSTKNWFETSKSDLSSLKDQLQAKVDELNSSTYSSNDSIQSVKQSLESVIDSLNTLVANNSYEDEIDSVYSTVDNLINPENGQITTALNTVENWLIEANQDGSVQMEYYDLIAKILLSIGAVLIGLVVVGFVLLTIFCKRVDGIYVSRSKLKKQLAIHIIKLTKKYPQLKKHLQEKHRIY